MDGIKGLIFLKNPIEILNMQQAQIYHDGLTVLLGIIIGLKLI